MTFTKKSVIILPFVSSLVPIYRATAFHTASVAKMPPSSHADNKNNKLDASLAPRLYRYPPTSSFLSMRGGSVTADDDRKNHSTQSTGREEYSQLSFLSKVLNGFFKGVTMPFPTLRTLAESSNDENKTIRVGFSLRESILAIVIYLALGVVSYSSTIFHREQAWSLVDALYFGGTCREL